MTKSNGHDGPNVTSLDEARRRAAEKAKADKLSAKRDVASRSARDWLLGGLIIAMALSYVASFFVGTEPVTTGGVQ